MHRSNRVVGICLLLLAPVANAAAAGSAEQGAKIAREFCSRCHNVEADGPHKQHPPSFASIAVFRSEEQIYGRIVFPPLHSAMPQLAYTLDPGNVDHLVAYILSLEKR